MIYPDQQSISIKYAQQTTDWAQPTHTQAVSSVKGDSKTFPENWVGKKTFFCFDFNNGLKNFFFLE